MEYTDQHPIVSVIQEATLFVAGLTLLIYGADRLVTEPSQLAMYYGVSEFFLGVTVVSVGTSIPEITTSILSSYAGAGDLVVGNIVGSEVTQITVAVGVVALISPVVADRRNVMVYGGSMTLAMVIMILTLNDGTVTFSEGFLMMLAYIQFIYTLYTNEGGGEVIEDDLEEKQPPIKTVPWIMGAVALVVLAGQVMVTNGVALAETAGIPQYLVGLVTGFGTTLPEITVAGIAARAGVEGISIGSPLGSNITDPVFSLGVGALVADIHITNLTTTLTSTHYMLAASLAVIALMYIQKGINRKTAVVCILLYLPSLLFV